MLRSNCKLDKVIIEKIFLATFRKVPPTSNAFALNCYELFSTEIDLKYFLKFSIFVRSRSVKSDFFQRDYSSNLKSPLHFEGQENFHTRNVFWQKPTYSSVTEKAHNGTTNSFIYNIHTPTFRLNIERCIKSKNISAIFVYRILSDQ